MTTSPLTPLADTSSFIDLGYHTVPLIGHHIKRNPQGKKYGYSFTNDWAKVNATNINQLPTPIGGLLLDILVAIDCDCEKSYNLFRQLDPTNQAYFNSIGKLDSNGSPIKCGTILYLRSPDLPPSKKLKGTLDLDWFNNSGMVFLPTESNETKTAWQTNLSGTLFNQDNQPVVFKHMPPLVESLLKLVIATPPPMKTIAETSYSSSSKGYLAIQLEQFPLKHEIYDPAVTRLLTPREYRNSKFKQQGHLHPQDAGARHDYLFKIMCTLAGDNTVDRTMALDTILYINSLLDPPRSVKQMHSEIIDSIISGHQKNPDGNPYWQYDPNWEDNRSFTAVSKIDGDLLHIFYDPFKGLYCVYNTVTDYIKEFKRKGELMEHISATSIGSFNQKEAINDMTNLKTVLEPTEDFGYIKDDTEFNFFKPTEALRIMSNPSIHKEEYRRPDEFINFMEHFIPDPTQRDYLLSLVKTKLTTFENSPVVPYIIGVPGSGKGLFMSVLENIISKQYVSKDVSGGAYISQFNKTILENKFFVNLNELAETLANKTERTLAIGNLKLHTGSDTFQCHGKGQNVYTADMNAMFIMTANKSPLDVEDDDRRIAYMGCPNTFKSSPQCQSAKSHKDIITAMMSQTLDIAYYLATEIDLLSDDAYSEAPKWKTRDEMLLKGKYPSEVIHYCITHKKLDVLYAHLDKRDALQLFNGESRSTSRNGATSIFLDDMVDSLLALTSMTDPIEARDILITTFEKVDWIRGAGSKKDLDRQGKKSHRLVVKELEGFIPPLTYDIEPDEEAEEIRI